MPTLAPRQVRDRMPTLAPGQVRDRNLDSKLSKIFIQSVNNDHAALAYKNGRTTQQIIDLLQGCSTVELQADFS